MEGFAGVLPKVLQLAERKSPQALTGLVTNARRDAIADDLPGSDSILQLKHIFKLCHYDDRHTVNS